MHRFSTKTTKYRNRKSFTWIFVLLCPIILFVFWMMVNSVNTTTTIRQQESLEKALNRDIIHCYAIEGYYPPSLAYLEDNYGLLYDKDLFFVDYQPIGSNMYPNVTILVNE